MSQKTRAIFLLLTIVAVLFASAFGTTTNVYADDGTPPPPPTETGEVDPSTSEAEPVATEPAIEPVVVEPVATEPAVTEPTEEAAPSEEAPVVEEQQPAEAEAAPILEQVPDNTVVTVLNAEGEAQPLTSQASADAIAASDPVWCPAGQAPGGAGCTPSFSSFQDLLAFMADPDNAITGAGTIYVQMGTYAGPETVIDFNAYDLSNISNSDLTVQGGWDLADNSTTDTTTLNVPITIGTSTNPWIGALTFNNIWISNVSNQTGLTLVSQNNITLSNVQVTNSQGGADLDAAGNVLVYDSEFSQNKKFGANIKSGGYVEVINSNFSDNKDNGADDGFGLKVDSQSGTFLGMVNANNNEEFGADITSAGSVTVWNSVFSGNVAYTTECKWVARETGKSCHEVCVTVKNGGGYGLKVVSTGADLDGEVYLQRVTAEDNYLFGAHLEGTLVTVDNEEVDGVIVGNSFSGNGSGAMDKPTGYGLEILSTMTQDKIEELIDLGILEEGQAAVTLRNVEANDNQLFGANVEAAGNVVINNSFFDGNKSYSKSCSWQAKKGCHEVCITTYEGYGLQVVTTDGNINLDTVSASENHLFGGHLKGTSVNVNNSVFSNNSSGSNSALTGRGLEIESTFNVNLAKVTANNNQQFGANVQAVNIVNVTLSTFNGHIFYKYSGNCTDEDKKACQDNQQPCVKTPLGGGYGIEVIATGPASQINVSGVIASDNYLFGMHLVASDVQISGDDEDTPGFEYTRAERNGEGIKIESQGPVSLDMVIANDNRIAGATILAGLDKSFFGAVSIANSFFSGNASYTSSKCSGKTYYGYGLRVVTTGDTINLTNVKADNNYLYGAYLEGGNISVSGVKGFVSTFDNNGTDNLADHIGSGLQIVSTGPSSTVDLVNVSASGNQLFGANIKAEGSVSVAKSVFSGNHSYASSCTSKSSNNYSKGGSSSGKSCGGKECTKTYYGYGIDIFTTGTVYMQEVTAENNYLYGAHVEGATVDIFTSTFSSNASPTEKDKTPTGRGLEVKSSGYVNLDGVDASNNQLFGATIEAGGEVTVLSSTFLNNKYYTSTSCKGKKSAGYGLKVVAIDPAIESPITLENVTASDNGAEGAILQGEEAAIAITDSTFNNNGADGLNVTASGDVTLTNVTADGNKGDGVDVKGVCTNTVNVSGGNFTNNDKYGLKVVDATYAPDSTNPPTFSSNDSGDFFQSDCVSSGGGNGSGNSGGGNTGGNHGSNWWYWWWYWHKGFGHHH